MNKPRLEAWKQLYLLIGTQEFNYIDIRKRFHFMEESIGKKFLLVQMIKLGYICGKAGKRKFSQKFIDEVIGNE